MEKRCQRCGCQAVASCTGKTSDLFGMRWPGGKEQSGYVPPHNLIGLREKGASSDYLNFSWCLVCGQIQGEWPTQAGVSHLVKYAEPRYWEAIICTTNTTRPDLEGEWYHGWYSVFFRAKTKERVEEHLEAHTPDQCVHWFVHEVCEETTVPDDADIEELD